MGQAKSSKHTMMMIEFNDSDRCFDKEFFNYLPPHEREEEKEHI